MIEKEKEIIRLIVNIDTEEIIKGVVKRIKEEQNTQLQEWVNNHRVK